MTKLTNFIESTQVRNFIIGVIIFNAIILGLETSSTMMSNFGGLIQALDKICLVIFVVELALKLIAYRFRFFTNWWNIFDTLVVAVSLIPSGASFTVLRALRIFRVLRVISTAPRLRRVVEGFITALPGMASVFLLMAIIFYIGSVISTKLFGASFPEWFGTLGQSAYSLFQIMTLESWSMGIVRPVMEVYPHAWVFFVPFIVVTTFAVVNLLVGLIVNSMQDAHHEDEHAEALAHRDELMLRLNAIEKKLDRLSK
jgi:voltage-gated sodium channel